MTDAELIANAIMALTDEIGRTLTEVETVQATRRVKNALVVIRGRLGADLTDVDDDSLVYVLGEVLLARSRNPEGYQSESIDDYTYRLPGETQRITILPEWWDLLSPARQSGAFSVRPSFERDYAWPNVASVIP